VDHEGLGDRAGGGAKMRTLLRLFRWKMRSQLRILPWDAAPRSSSRLDGCWPSPEAVGQCCLQESAGLSTLPDRCALPE
jgi:hypothetical protein